MQIIHWRHLLKVFFFIKLYVSISEVDLVIICIWRNFRVNSRRACLSKCMRNTQSTWRRKRRSLRKVDLAVKKERKRKRRRKRNWRRKKRRMILSRQQGIVKKDKWWLMNGMKLESWTLTSNRLTYMVKIYLLQLTSQRYKFQVLNYFNFNSNWRHLKNN